ncbi:MAG: hypothetical protein IJW16_04655 [Clostridia bacterium]|nr:hypothetical protein [Clostridia bacterium]
MEELTNIEAEATVVAEPTEQSDVTEPLESEEERIKREKAALQERSARLRRRVVPIVAICLAVLIVVPLALILIINHFQDADAPTYRPIEFPTYTFHPVYEGDILEYELYLAQNREVYFYDNLKGYGTRYTVTEEESDANLHLIYDYLQSIIHGDADTYNSFFNAVYYESHEKEAPFAQQMLYNMAIYSYSEESLERGEKLYTYQLDYMIMQNNGTFRTDIGSDMIRPQYLVLHRYADGTVKIENLVIKRMAEKVE